MTGSLNFKLGYVKKLFIKPHLQNLEDLTETIVADDILDDLMIRSGF